MLGENFLSHNWVFRSPAHPVMKHLNAFKSPIFNVLATQVQITPSTTDRFEKSYT